MTLKSHAKFEEKLNCGLENDMRNLANIHQNTVKIVKSVKIGIFMGSIFPKQKMHEHELNIYRGVTCNDTEE